MSKPFASAQHLTFFLQQSLRTHQYDIQRHFQDLLGFRCTPCRALCDATTHHRYRKANTRSSTSTIASPTPFYLQAEKYANPRRYTCFLHRQNPTQPNKKDNTTIYTTNYSTVQSIVGSRLDISTAVSIDYFHPAPPSWSAREGARHTK